MMNFLFNLFAPKKENVISVTDKLLNAVREDNVRLAYELLHSGANANYVISYQSYETVDGYDGYKVTKYNSLLDIARSAPMQRLLKHFGAITYEEMKKIRKEKQKAQNDAEQLKKQEEQKQEKEKKKQKADADNLFLDSVLR